MQRQNGEQFIQPRSNGSVPLNFGGQVQRQPLVRDAATNPNLYQQPGAPSQGKGSGGGAGEAAAAAVSAKVAGVPVWVLVGVAVLLFMKLK